MLLMIGYTTHRQNNAQPGNRKKNAARCW
jgi:hypothetical protein